MRFLVTGKPGSGKTTLLKRLHREIGGCGVITEELRVGGVRVGFDAVNLRTLERCPLARVGEGKVKVGKYAVNLSCIEKMMEWMNECKGLKFFDEIGPMELKHPNMRDFLLKIEEPFVMTVHYSLWRKWKELLNADVFFLTKENRDLIFNRLISLLK